MRRLLSFVISFFAGLIIFLFIIAKAGFNSIGYAFSLLFGFEGLLAVLFGFAFIILGILKWRAILKWSGYKFSLKELSPLWLLGFTASYLTPFAVFGGEFFRIYFTKKKFPQVPYEKNMASVAIDKILDGTVFLGFLLFGVLIFTFYGRLPSSFLSWGGFVIVGFFLCALALFYFKLLRKESALEWFFKVFSFRKKDNPDSKAKETFLKAEKEVFRFFSLREKAFWQALGLTFSRYLMHTLRALFIIFFFTGKLEALKALAVQGFVHIASLTPLPATLGALELSQGVAFKVLGLGFSNGAVFSMVWRGADILIIVLGLVFIVKLLSALLSAKLASWGRA